MGDFNQEYRPKLESQISSLKVLQRMCEKISKAEGMQVQHKKASWKSHMGLSRVAERQLSRLGSASCGYAALHQVVPFLGASVSSSVTSVGCNTLNQKDHPQCYKPMMW